MAYLFFKRPLTPPEKAPALPPGLEFRLWRPAPFRLLPPQLPWRPFLLWSLFHHLGLFATGEYALALVFQGGRLVHRTCLLPAHFRCPFMGPRDLQAAAIWTHPDLRGRGVGPAALRSLLEPLADPDRSLWYMAREENGPSIRLARKAGFQLQGRGGAMPGGLGRRYRITERP
jgi:RimJ/RimL family protein N-acetyltransferase